MSEGLSAQQINEALLQLREEPYGVARSARIEELVETAEQLALDEVYAAGMFELMQSYEYGAEIHKTPILFAQILKLYDTRPEAFNDWRVHRMYWYFKWITNALLAVPEVPLTSIEAFVGQMRERYKASGHKLHAVYRCRFDIALHTGLRTEDAYEDWATRPRDSMSDCEACEARNRGRYWYHHGDGDLTRALREWDPVLSGEASCDEEPAATISHALPALVRARRLDEAVSLHRSGYRSTRGKPAMDGEVGRHIEFAALTGNEPRGLELLAENRGRLDSAADPLSRLEFLTGVRVLLTRLAAAGHGSVVVPGQEGAEHTVDAQLAHVAEQTDALAARFDARNGTSTIGDRLRARIAQAPLTADPLPLGLGSAFNKVLRAPDGATAASGESAKGIQATAQKEMPTDFGILLAMAREAYRDGRPSDALWDLVAERVDEAELDELLRGELANHEASKATEAGDWPVAREAVGRSQAHMIAAGEPSRALAAAARTAWYAATAESAEQAATAVWQELDEVLAQAEILLAQNVMSARQFLSILHCRVGVAGLALRGDRASSQALPVGTDPARAADRQRFEQENQAFRERALHLEVFDRAAIALGMSANLLATEGNLVEAEPQLREALALLDRAQQPWHSPQLLWLLVEILHRTKRLDEAANLLHRLRAVLDEWPDQHFSRGGLIAMQAENRHRASDHTAAAGLYAAAAARFDLDGKTVEAARARAALGQALLRTGRTEDAMAVLESLFGEEAESSLDPEIRAQARLDLGNALMAGEEYRAAAESFVWLADFTTAWPSLDVHTMVCAKLAAALFAAGLWAQADQAAERALTSHAGAPNPAEICRMLRTAAETSFQARGPEGVDQAVEYLRQADQVNESAQEREEPGYRYWRFPERAQNAMVRATGLAGAGRNEEALAATELAIAAWHVGADTGPRRGGRGRQDRRRHRGIPAQPQARGDQASRSDDRPLPCRRPGPSGRSPGEIAGRLGRILTCSTRIYEWPLTSSVA